jgi:hypothetical protein
VRFNSSLFGSVEKPQVILTQRMSVGTLNTVEEGAQGSLIGGVSASPFGTVRAAADMIQGSAVPFAIGAGD